MDNMNPGADAIFGGQGSNATVWEKWRTSSLRTIWQSNCQWTFRPLLCPGRFPTCDSSSRYLMIRLILQSPAHTNSVSEARPTSKRRDEHSSRSVTKKAVYDGNDISWPEVCFWLYWERAEQGRTCSDIISQLRSWGILDRFHLLSHFQIPSQTGPSSPFPSQATISEWFTHMT